MIILFTCTKIKKIKLRKKFYQYQEILFTMEMRSWKQILSCPPRIAKRWFTILELFREIIYKSNFYILRARICTFIIFILQIIKMCHPQMLEIEKKSQFFSEKPEKKIVGGGQGTHDSLNRIYYFYSAIEWQAER